MLKQVLLHTGYFVDNSYLDDYLELIQKPFSFSGYSEKHHFIPAVVYDIKYSLNDNQKARRLANNDANNFLVDLLFKDHCRAHWLLYNCTVGEVKACNARAYILMTGKKLEQITELTTEEYNEVQKYRDLIMDEDDYYWSLEEKQILYDHYTDYSFEELINVLHKPKYCIIATANRLGLYRPRDRFWTAEDEQWLINNYHNHSRKECADSLNKTEASINKKCRTLKLYKEPITWTAEQNEWLINNYSNYTPIEAAEILGRTYNAVCCQARKLGLQAVVRCKNGVATKARIDATKRFSWTRETEQWLLDNFTELGIHGCAEQLKLSDSAVYHKYFRLTHK